MDAYHVALYIHFLALISAACASSLAHFAHARFAKADTPKEAGQWLAFTGKVAKTFPIAIVTLLLTGGYMTSATGAWSWSLGWVQAGATGAVLLFIMGATAGVRGRAVGARLQELAASGYTQADLAACHDPVADTLSWMNTGLALSIVFVMTTKPAGPGAFGEILIGALLGAVVSRMFAVPRHVEATESVRA
jgi:type IV secretory pathway VirB2 component (pilin)